ncbi:MAG: hypothetical protein ABI880_06590 [Acidobacteriota bacterium]
MPLARSSASWSLAIVAVAALALPMVAGAQTPPPAPVAPRILPLEPARERGASITPAYEGWYENADGSFSLMVGYYNRNKSETLEIPVGPNNRIEPGDIDQGQPTFFEVGREWGVFVIKVPKDFGTKAITWTIVSNGEAQSIPLSLNKGYPVTPYEEAGMGNRPPVFTFAEGGATFTGPPTAVAATLTATAKQPLALNMWVSDPKEQKAGLPPRRPVTSLATVSFHKHRGPGTITFTPATAPVAAQGDKVATMATFSLPGEYLLRVQGNDESGEGGGGFQCCWTNTYVKVSVK